MISKKLNPRFYRGFFVYIQRPTFTTGSTVNNDWLRNTRANHYFPV